MTLLISYQRLATLSLHSRQLEMFANFKVRHKVLKSQCRQKRSVKIVLAFFTIP